MVNQIVINGRNFQVTNFYQEEVFKETNKQAQIKIGFDFKVTSEEYHDVTTLLYENDFDVQIPEQALQFKATIQNYATSLTNLYEANQISDYHLELIEKLS